MTPKNDDLDETTTEDESGTVKFGVSMHTLTYGKLESLKKTLKTSRSGAIQMLIDTYSEPMGRKMTKNKS